MGGSLLLYRDRALLLSWPFINSYLTPILPDSEWAYETTGIEITGVGFVWIRVSVCIVDTKIDISHPDLSGINLVGWVSSKKGIGK